MTYVASYSYESSPIIAVGKEISVAQPLTRVSIKLDGAAPKWATAVYGNPLVSPFAPNQVGNGIKRLVGTIM